MPSIAQSIRKVLTMTNIFPRIQTALSGEPKAADVAKLITEAEAELTALTDKQETLKATALDPMATEDAVRAARTELSEIDFSRERLAVALDRLRETHRAAQEGERATSRADAYDKASADLERTSAALEARYPELARELVDLLIPALEAYEAATAANTALPEGRPRIKIPAVLTGMLAARPEQVIEAEEVTAWAFPSTNALLSDDQVKQVEKGYAGEGKLNGRPVVQRKFRRERYIPGTAQSRGNALWAALSLPPVRHGEPAFWQAADSMIGAPSVGKAVAAARKLQAQHEAPKGKPAAKVRHVALEPATPTPGFEGPHGDTLRIVA